jgi:tripartite-type tricarboxylate transporter receptor subunit TctC
MIDLTTCRPKARLLQAPELPTVAEGGLPGYEATAWFGYSPLKSEGRGIPQLVHDCNHMTLNGANLMVRSSLD